MTSLVAGAAVAPAAFASSHREAPMIAGMPRLDASDFFMFNSYETGRTGYVTMIADYVPLQDPSGGPNFYNLETNGYYDINIDNKGTGLPAFAYRFRFTTTNQNLAVNVNGKSVPIALVNDGPIAPGNTSAQNVIQTYTISLVTFNARGQQIKEQLLTNANGGGTTFQKPEDNIGDKSVPNYTEYANTFIYNVTIPGCGTGRIFVGQRKDPFVVNLGETFDLVNYVHPVGEQYAASAMDDLAGKNVTSFVWEVPSACLTNTGGSSSIGAWTTSFLKIGGGSGPNAYTQVSRLANPLVNELVIGLKDKDKFNASVPANDAQFLTYVTNPTVPALIQALFPGVTAPTKFPRTDLEAVFLTGVPGVNATGGKGVPSEEMRLNTTTPITPFGQQNRLGVIGGDNAGYPNGRRPGDDVVDITLRVAMGKLYTLGLAGGTAADAPSGSLEFTDGAFTDSTHYLPAFPYVAPPLSDSHQPNHQPQ